MHMNTIPSTYVNQPTASHCNITELFQYNIILLPQCKTLTKSRTQINTGINVLYYVQGSYTRGNNGQIQYLNRYDKFGDKKLKNSVTMNLRFQDYSLNDNVRTFIRVLWRGDWTRAP